MRKFQRWGEREEGSSLAETSQPDLGTAESPSPVQAIVYLCSSQALGTWGGRLNLEMDSLQDSLLLFSDILDFLRDNSSLYFFLLFPASLLF